MAARTRLYAMTSSLPPRLERTVGLTVGDQLQWLEAVLDLLPYPFLLVEPGTGRVLFANRAAEDFPLEPPGTEAAYAVDRAGQRVAPDDLPHRRAARGEHLDGQEITWHTPDGSCSFLVFSGAVPALFG